MKGRGVTVLMTSFFLIFVVSLFCFQFRKPRIFILHSFDKEFVEMRSLDRGFQRSLKASRLPVTIRQHYMNHNRSRTPDDIVSNEQAAILAIRQDDPDLLLAIDDEANAFIKKTFGPNYPFLLFYLSINQSPIHYEYEGLPGVTGMKEMLPLLGLKESLPYLSGKDSPLRIAALGSDRPTGRAELMQVKAMNWHPHTLVGSALAHTEKQWQQAFQTLNTQADLVLILTSTGLAAGSSSEEDLIQWAMPQSQALLVGLHERFVAQGGAIAFATDEDEEGELAMGHVLRWIQAKDPSRTSPIAYQTPFELHLQPTLLAERKIVLPQIYLELARMTDNK
jgi:hypothetical protein